MGVRRQHLARRRRMLGLSQEQLAERVGVDRSTVARWERGESAPHPWHRPALARTLKVTAEELDDLLAGHAAVSDTPALHLDHALAHPAVADLAAVDGLRGRVADIGSAYDTSPSAALLAEAGQCFGQIGHLRRHAASGQAARELARAECEVALLLGKLVWDASGRRDQQGPRAYLDGAIGAARHLGDLAAEGHALLRMAYLALYGGDPGSGERLASAAAATAGHASSALTGLALAHAAEGHAMLGESRRCEESLARAGALLDRADEADVAAGLFSPAQFCRIAGSCYLRRGRTDRARALLGTAAGMLSRGSKSRAIVLGNLALASIRQGDLDLAAANLSEAITVIEQTWGGGGLTVAFTAARELRPWRGEPAVQDTCDRLLALMTAA